MDTRIALKKGTVLDHHEHGFCYEIEEEIARGGSCIVYDAVYRMENGQEKKVKLKECYPFHLHMKRKEDGSLYPESEENDYFEKIKETLCKAFYDGNSLFMTEGLTNATANMLQCFEENNTVYIPSTNLEGNTLTKETFSNLKDCIQIVITVARVIEQIHRAGYLYLDLKPENIFVITNVEGKGATEVVQLFDFDSLIEVKNLKNPEGRTFRLSYTQGYAALEHQMGNFQKLGFFTDVYSVGAVLFYLIFGRPPAAMDCEDNAEYHFSEGKYGDHGYQDKLFLRLTEFFHHALASYRFDRYQTMEEAIEKLKEISLLADKTIPYLKSTNIIYENRFIGRNAEREILEQWFYQSKEECFFLTGMGGIGKSSFVRNFILAQKSEFSVVYLYYKDSLKEMIADDFQVQVNTIERDTEEDINSYFLRKLKAISKLLHGKKGLLVIDDYQGEMTKEFQQILNVGWKVLVISRKQPPSCNYSHLELKALSEIEEQCHLFQIYLGFCLNTNDLKYFMKITNSVQGHTLVLEVLAKQIKRSKLTLKEVAALIEDVGFADIVPEKVRYEKDYETKNETIREIISAVFFFRDQGEAKYRILKILSLFQQPGISMELICEILEISLKDDFYELMEEGWISICEDQISLHPVIKETIEGWEWKEKNIQDAKCIIKYLFINVRLESEKEEYPVSLLNINKMLDQLKRENRGQTKWLEKYIEKQGLLGDLYKERMKRIDSQEVPNPEFLTRLLQISEGVLNSCSKQQELKESELYACLSSQVLLHISIEKETFITKYMKEAIYHPFGKNAYIGMRLYKRWISIYLEQRRLDDAWNIIMEVQKYIRGCNHYVKAEYYDICGKFYDTRLDGNYHCDNEYHDLYNLKKAIDKSIFHMNLAHGGRKVNLLCEYMIAKTNVLIRSTPDKKHEIEKLLNRIKKLLEKHTQIYSKLRRDYYMTKAFYHTLVDPDEEKVKELCAFANDIINITNVTDIERIDLIYVPFANMMVEFEKVDRAALVLLIGIRLCERHSDMIPYIRKQIELYHHLLDLLYWKNDLIGCQMLVAFLDEQNAKREEYDMRIDIPDEIRTYVNKNV